MIERRPVIMIYTFRPDSNVIKEVCAGMEEEGVFYQLNSRDDIGSGADDSERASLLAWQAAYDSVLGSGVGICRNAVALQMKGLKRGLNVESYQSPTAIQSRKIGSNAARAVKRQPLK